MTSYRDFFSLAILLGKSMKVGFPKHASFTYRVTAEHANLHVKWSKNLQINYNNLKETYCYYVSNSVYIKIIHNFNLLFRNEVDFNLMVSF